jgi:hypothetical protein
MPVPKHHNMKSHGHLDDRYLDDPTARPEPSFS